MSPADPLPRTSRAEDDREISPFLHPAPPSWAARGLAWIVITLVVVAAIAAAIIHVPETVSSEFQLVPARGVDPVRAARAGRVTEVQAVEGTTVAKGQTLFVIRSVAVGDQSAELAALETQLRGAVSARANAREKFESERLADEQQARGLAERRAHLAQRTDNHQALKRIREVRYRASREIADKELASIQAEIEFKREHLGLAREIAQRHKRGYESNFLSWQEYMQVHIEASKVAVDLEQLQRQLDVAVLKVTQLRAEREAEENEWKAAMSQIESEQKEVQFSMEKLRHESQGRASESREQDRRLLEDVAKAGIRTTAVREALVDAKGDRLSVPAPCAGPVVRLVVKRPDAVVQEGEVLCELACSGERLQAELIVPPSGIGKIRRGHGVKLRYEAFPYERYGIRHATVERVSSVGVSGKGGPEFRAFAALEEEMVRIDGQPRALLAGMGGRADIVVGRRSLASFAFEPFRRLKENLAGGGTAQ
jgi:multidrug efflux pump subunit AcrA (membrane-fusion protein)